MLLQSQTDASDVLEMSEENMKLLKEDAKLTDLNGVMRYIRIFSELSGQLKIQARSVLWLRLRSSR